MAAEAHWRRPWEAEWQQQPQTPGPHQQHSAARPPGPLALDTRPNGLGPSRSTATTPTSLMPAPLASPHEVRLPPIHSQHRRPSNPPPPPPPAPPPGARAPHPYLPREEPSHRSAHGPPSPKRPRLEHGEGYRTSRSSEDVKNRSYISTSDPRHEHPPAYGGDPYGAAQAQGLGHPGFRPGFPSADPSRGPAVQLAQCRNCGSLQPMVEELVSHLAELDLELRDWTPGKTATTTRADVPPVQQVGLPQSLDWAIRTLLGHQASVQHLRSRCATLEMHVKPGPGGLDNVEEMKRRVEALERERDEAVMIQHHLADHTRQNSLSEAHRPDRRASSSVAHPTPSPQTAHFQDLQHQVSTKALALQTLQQEHDNLLAAFSRTQARCSTLEKKFQISDAEIANLTEDRIKLQGQVDAFETQVDELVRSRDEARKQSVANGGQYIQIMERASMLEAQGSADKKSWEAERDEWADEREKLNQRIDRLEKDNEMQLNLLFAPKGVEPDPKGTQPLTITTTKTAKLTSPPAEDSDSRSSYQSLLAAIAQYQASVAGGPAGESNPVSATPAPAAAAPPPSVDAPSAPSAPPAVTKESSPSTVRPRSKSPPPEPATTTAESKPGPPSPSTANRTIESLFGDGGPAAKAQALSTSPSLAATAKLSHPLSSPSLALTSTDPSAQDSILRSTSLPVLRNEIVNLRKCCQNMEVAMNDIKSEGYRVDQLMIKFGNIGKRLVSKAEGGLRTRRELIEKRATPGGMGEFGVDEGMLVDEAGPA